MTTLLVAAVAGPTGAQQVRGTEALARSIAYHDSAGAWSQFAGTLVLDEIRPDGSSRRARVTLDVPDGFFRYELPGPPRVVKAVRGNACTASVDGVTTLDAAVRERYHLGCDQILVSRNYYLYLWGLPMKLADSGTRVGEWARPTTFQGKSVLAVRVTYDPEVGSDTWYFYLDPATWRLIGYRFYHDESANDGEYIVLSGQYDVGGLRIPRTRRWYGNPDDGFLGTDSLVAVEPSR